MYPKLDAVADQAEAIVAAEAATAGMEEVWPALVTGIALWQRHTFGPALHVAVQEAGIACQHHELEMAAVLFQTAADYYSRLADETPCTKAEDEDASEDLRDLA